MVYVSDDNLKILTGSKKKLSSTGQVKSGKIIDESYNLYRTLKCFINFIQFTLKMHGIKYSSFVCHEALGFLTKEEQNAIYKFYKTRQKAICLEKNKPVKKLNNYDIISWCLKHENSREYYKKILPYLKQKEVLYRNNVLNAPIIEKLKTLKKLFQLNKYEIDMVYLAYMNGYTCNLRDLSNSFEKDLNLKNLKYSSFSFHFYSIISNMIYGKVLKAFNLESNLRRNALVEENDSHLTEEIYTYLTGESLKPLVNVFYGLAKNSKYSTKDLAIEDNDISIIKRLLKSDTKKRGTNILLFGEPGTGKTELTKAIAKEMKYQLFEIKESDSDKKKLFRFRALTACTNSINKKNSIILIDEADAMLNIYSWANSEQNILKGLLNNILDNSLAKIIWITNDISALDSSVKRRFDYSIKFSKLTGKQRESVWHNSINNHSLNNQINDNIIKELANKYEINAGNIELAVSNFSRIDKSAQTIQTLKTLLKSCVTLTKGESNIADRKIKSSNNYSLDGLNIRGDIDQTLSILEGFNKELEKSNKNPIISNMNMLLHVC